MFKPSGIDEFSASKLFSIDLGAGLADPELEEAAIRFANGDDAGAEAGLLDALRAIDATPESADGWAAALFDFYRATGQQASFDSVAIDYAQRFGRSAPAWFSTPDLLGRKVAPVSNRDLASSAQSDRTLWECPPAVAWADLQTLVTSLSNGSMTLHLNWSRLSNMSSDAAKVLADLFAQWCSKPYKLYFSGVGVLEEHLKSWTPSGDKNVEPFWWKLRLDALRILRLQDEFELAALEFCITYEVSPPPWQEALCELIPESPSSALMMESAHGVLGSASTGYFADSSHSSSTTIMGFDGIAATQVELYGEVLGDAVGVLDKLQAGLAESNRLVISCARLIRVDFSAAGSILNWVAVRESEGCHVQFRDVPRLVAAFFNVIGINEHAQVILRTS